MGQVLITGARVYTADLSAPWAEVVLVEGNRIRYVGAEAEARQLASARAEEIHVPGGLVTPGINDSHVHLSHGAHTLTVLDLTEVVTMSELQARLHAYAGAHPEREWIEGAGTLYELFLGLGRPEREAIDDAISDRPVFLRSFDYHSAWSNTEALRRAGIERGADVARPNEVVVDEASGLATGMLKERGAYHLVDSLIPISTAEEQDAAFRQALQRLNRFGITSVQDMEDDPGQLERYRRLLGRDKLTIRATHYMILRPGASLDRVHEVADLAAHTAECDEVARWHRVNGIKLFFDGVVEARTALMFEPYSDGSNDAGTPDMEPDLYRSLVLQADTLGLDVATHAIGDRAVHLVLDAYQAARAMNCRDRERRHRVEHIEVIRPSDLSRFQALGVTASMQPYHAAPTTDPRLNVWTGLVGPQREPYAFPWRSLLEAGAHLAFGSDWPVVTPDPRVGLRTAVARTNSRREPPGGWQPQQAVTLAQALDAYTRGAAYAERQEGMKGMLRPGMLADLTLFAHNLFALAPEDYPRVDIVLTMVDGRIVHRAA